MTQEQYPTACPNWRLNSYILRGITAMLAAQVILNFLGFIFHERD